MIVANTLDGNSIRVLSNEDPEKVGLSLELELEFSAKFYCGCQGIGNMEMSEMVTFVTDRWGHLGVPEIREAFRLAASGVLGEIDMSAYYGTFTGGLLGRILRMYDEFRKSQIIAKFQQGEVLGLPAPGSESAMDMWLKRVSLSMSGDRESMVVTVKDYEKLTELGLLNLTRDEKFDAWERAVLVVKGELQIKLLSRNVSDRLEGGGGLSAFRMAQIPGWLYSRIVDESQRIAARDWFLSAPSDSLTSLTARDEDERRGFTVEIVDEHGLTPSDYYHGVTYPNG